MQIAFYKGRERFTDKFIGWWLDGKYTHAELIIGTCMDGSKLCVSSSSLDGGVRLKQIKLNPAHWDVVEVGGNQNYAIEWYLDHRDGPYDWLGLLGFVYRRYHGKRHKWFCSEAIMAMLQYQDPWRFEPNLMHSFFNNSKSLVT